jgi:hypothetical protein
MVPQRVEMSLALDAREQLLPDGTQNQSATFPDQFRQLEDVWRLGGPTSPQSQRPNRRVDDDVQDRRRWRL